MRKKLLCSAALFLPLGLAAPAQQLPIFSPGGPDSAAYGAAEHFPIGTVADFFQQKYLVGSFSHFDKLFPGRAIAPSSQVWQFKRFANPPEITYFHAGNKFPIGDYLDHLPVTGLLIAKDDYILFETYQYGRTDRDRFTSQSMAKTIVAMLMGIANSEHAISSINDTAAKYLPELGAAAYGKITIRDLLHMSSGMSCSTTNSEFDTISIDTLVHNCKPEAPPGTRFEYSPYDSQLLGLILSRAVKMPLATYLDQRIWRNIGTEASASWTTDASGHETSFCCFNAVLRDYARFARLLAFGGEWFGKTLIPQQWISDATSVSDPDSPLAPGRSTPFFGYGYQTWILPGPRHDFALLGANGQRIFVDPQSKLIMVQTAVMPKGIDRKADAEMIGLWLSLVRHFGQT